MDSFVALIPRVGFLWPIRAASNQTTVLVRLGRVLHWIGVTFAVVAWCTAIIIPFLASDLAGFVILALLLVVGGVAFLSGRGIRYVLANE